MSANTLESMVEWVEYNIRGNPTLGELSLVSVEGGNNDDDWNRKKCSMLVRQR